MASNTNTPLHHWNNKQLIYDAEGNALPDELTDRLSTLLWEIIELAFKHSEEAHAEGKGEDIPSRDSLYDFVKRKATEMIPDLKERGILLQMSEMFGAYVGEPVWRQSLRFAWMEECCGGGTHTMLPQHTCPNAMNRGDVRRVQLLGHSSASCQTRP